MRRKLLPLACALVLTSFSPAGTSAAQRSGVRGGCIPSYVERLGTACRTADGHYKVFLTDGAVLMTHGPDPKPEIAAGHGRYLAPGDPERSPACATDYYQQVLYGYPSGASGRLSSVAAEIRSSIRRMNAVLDEASTASGGPNADYKIRCTSAGEIRIDTFVGPARSTNFSDIVDAARNAGFRSSRADYSIFYDAQDDVACGVGSFWNDDRPGTENLNNQGGGYAVNFSECWDGSTPMHENGHNQGAVQVNAPMSDRNAHCLESGDIMCYTDVLPIPFIFCNVVQYDCGFDSYFDSAPEPGEWLATHWNIGGRNNRFIKFGG